MLDHNHVGNLASSLELKALSMQTSADLGFPNFPALPQCTISLCAHILAECPLTAAAAAAAG